MELELAPEQPQAVVDALTALVELTSEDADPWWQAGLDETLGR